VIVGLGGNWSEVLSKLSTKFLEFPIPPDVSFRAAIMKSSVASDPTLTSELSTAGGIPTTLFKRSRQEASAALMAGYINTMIAAYVYEDIPLPSGFDVSAAHESMAKLGLRLQGMTGMV
jgi:hypothetical protein